MIKHEFEEISMSLLNIKSLVVMSV